MAWASIFSTTGACRQRQADCRALDSSACKWTAWRDILEMYPLFWMALQARSVVPWYRWAGGAAGVSSGSTQGMEWPWQALILRLVRAEAVAALAVRGHKLLQSGHGEAVPPGLVDILNQLCGADSAVAVHIQPGVLGACRSRRQR